MTKKSTERGRGKKVNVVVYSTRMYIQSEIPVAFHHHHHFPSLSLSLPLHLFLTGWRWNGLREGMSRWRWDLQRRVEWMRGNILRGRFFSFLCIPKYKHIPCLILQLLLVAFMRSTFSLSLSHLFTHSRCAIINNCIVRKKIRVYWKCICHRHHKHIPMYNVYTAEPEV